MKPPLFAIVGPSGAGKDTLLDYVASKNPRIHVARRVITRPRDAGGENHEAATLEQFRIRKENGEFFIHWEAHGLHYGIPNSELENSDADAIIFNCSRKALNTIIAHTPELTVIAITAKPEVLAARLAARGRETLDDIRTRLSRSAPISLPIGTRQIIIENNDDIEAAAALLMAVLNKK